MRRAPVFPGMTRHKARNRRTWRGLSTLSNMRHKRAGLVPVALSLAAMLACAINPVTHRTELSLVSESQEVAMGREADKEIVATMGLYDDRRAQEYVAALGRKLAAKSERPNLPWTFRVVDDPVVNAFAIPGGFVYVTRGLMTHLTSEAELAAVMGHEIGHVTAKHSVSQMSRAQLAQIGLGVGSILDPRIGQAAGALSQGLGLLFLKFGRDDERQADDIGLRYLVNAGYDPRPMADVFDMLQRVSAAQGSGRVPNWMSTHPAPEDRRAWAAAKIQGLNRDFGNAINGREPYLAVIDGMTYGEDPRNGYFRGDTFVHPALRFRIDFPAGWAKANRADSVGATNPDNNATIRLMSAPETSPDAAADAFFSKAQGVQASPSVRDDANGLHAVSRQFSAPTAQTPVSGIARFVGLDGKVYSILGYGTETGWRTHRSPIGRSLESFQRLTDPKILAVQPWRIELVTLDQPLTPQEFVSRYPGPATPSQVALVNRLGASGRVPAGPGAKRIVGEKLP